MQLVVVTSLAALGFGFIARGGFTLAYVFPANFALGAFIICIGLVMTLAAGRIKFDTLTDHSTFAERFFEKYARNKEKAAGFLFLGIAVIIVTGLIQIALAVVIRS